MTDSSIGRRVREIRTWRGLTLRACAELAGLSESYLSRIERGERAVDRRSTLEALATALRVAPSELAEQAFPPASADAGTGPAAATIVDLDTALSDIRLGDDGGRAARPWDAVAADLDDLNGRLRPAADYAAQGAVLPGLIGDLHALHVTDGAHRHEILAALVDVYHASAVLTKNLGVRGLPSLAAYHALDAATALGDPAYLGLAAWVRSSTLGGAGRARMLELSLDSALVLEEHADDPRARQMLGALQLNAALASAALGRASDAFDHLGEAESHAHALGGEGRGFGNLYFGPDNTAIWRLSITVELDDPGKAREIARGIDPSAVPSAARQGMYWADLGRGLATQKATRGDAVAALARAERIAPQRIRTHPFVRETIGDLLRRSQRDAPGRELRGLAYRCGIAG